ncbi:DUF6879 family protein [Nonomuraea sp. NPDC050790]|uniref:DUF6879 family protein n=1 Tax=Nonomuraea sp. NPDC050790 TaxID=3364371 RepID=UPI00378816BC
MKILGQDSKKPTFAELLADCTTSAVHLEMHDQHMTSNPSFQAWKAGKPFIDAGKAKAWVDLVSAAVTRGVSVRRARIVSEPASDYVRWEHAVAPAFQLAAGEQLRWLPRPLASGLALPGNPYWVFDGHLVRFSLFDGEGELQGHQFTEDASLVGLCESAFEAVWELATPHEKYQI